MSLRPSTTDMRKALKLATRAALKIAGGAAALVESRMVRVGEASLSFYASSSDEHDTRSVPMDVALDLDFLAGEPLHARAIAHAQGYRLAPAYPRNPGGMLCLSDVARISRDFAEVQSTCFDALDDCVITEAERVAIIGQLGELERSIEDVRAKLTTHHSCAGPKPVASNQ